MFPPRHRVFIARSSRSLWPSTLPNALVAVLTVETKMGFTVVMQRNVTCNRGTRYGPSLGKMVDTHLKQPPNPIYIFEGPTPTARERYRNEMVSRSLLTKSAVLSKLAHLGQIIYRYGSDRSWSTTVGHLVPRLPLWAGLQDLHSTDTTQKTCAMNRS